MASPTFNQFRDAVKKGWIDPIVGVNVPVVWGRQNAPRPRDSSDSNKVAPLYVVILPLNFEAVGWDEELDPTLPDYDARVIGIREGVVTVECLGVGGLDLAFRLRDSVWLNSVTKILQPLGVAIVEAMGVRDLTGLFDTTYKERGSFDVRFRFTSEAIDKAVGVIEKVSGEEIIKVAGTVDGTENFDFDAS